MTTIAEPSTTTSTTGSGSTPGTTSGGRGWVYAGVGAAVAGIVSIVGSSMTDAVYRDDIAGDAEAIAAKLAEQTGSILMFHTGAMVCALLLLVFAAGLRRRLAASTGVDSLLPQVAGSGLVVVSVVLLMGSALTTEFVFVVKEPGQLVPETAAFFGHWINTVPWVWASAGVTALAVGIAGLRHGAVPRWLTWVSLGLGVLTVLFGISPLQYMAGATGPLWLTIAALGLIKRR